MPTYSKYTLDQPPTQLAEKLAFSLRSSGESTRLSAFIPSRLAELGWSERVMEQCREYIRLNSASGQSIQTGSPEGTTDSVEPIDVHLFDIIDSVGPQAKIWLPDQLKQELIHRIIEFIQEQELD